MILSKSEEDLFTISSYFFENLMNQYNKIEKDYEKKSKRIIRRIHFHHYVLLWEDLIEALNDPLEELRELKVEMNLSALHSIAMAGYLSLKKLIESQIDVVTKLDAKSHGKEYSMKSYRYDLQQTQKAREEFGNILDLYQVEFEKTIDLYNQLGLM